MRPHHQLGVFAVVSFLGVNGCQLVSGVDTIEYSANPGGAGGRAQATTTGQNATAASNSTSTGSGMASSASGTGGATPCGDGKCGPGESTCTCKTDCADKSQANNGCCETSEPAVSQDCGPIFFCNHDGVCSSYESCDHCDDCGCSAPGDCPAAACAKDCAHNAECGVMSGSSSSGGSGTPVCCQCSKGPAVCVPQYPCSNMACSTLP